MFTQLSALESVEIVSFFYQSCVSQYYFSHVHCASVQVHVHGSVPVFVLIVLVQLCVNPHTRVCTLIHVCVHAVSSKCYPPLWCGNV